MPPRRDRPNPVLNIELRVTFAADADVLDRIAKSDDRVRISRRGCSITVRSESPATAIAELRRFTDQVRKATRSERV